MKKWIKNLFSTLYKFFIHKCPKCGSKLTEFRNVHTTCRKFDI